MPSWSFNLPTVCPVSSRTWQTQSKLHPDKPNDEVSPLLVLFLTSDVTNEQRSKVLVQLCDSESADSWPEKPKSVRTHPVTAAKWIRNWTPGEGAAPSIETCLARMVRTSTHVTSITRLGEVRIVPGNEAFGKRLGCGMILVGRETLRGLDTEKGAEVIVLTWVWVLRDETKDPEHDPVDPNEDELQIFAARVPIRRANLLLSFAYDSITHQSLEEVVPGMTKLEFSEAGNSLLNQNKSEMSSTKISPSHLSTAARVTKDTIGVVSLVHLTDEEIENVKTRIRKTSKELKDDDEEQQRRSKTRRKNRMDDDDQTLPVEVYNWPKETAPCSRHELYGIFQSIQPSFLPNRKAKNALFVDIANPSADSRSKPELLLATQSRSLASRVDEDNGVELISWRDDESVMDLWPFVCDPQFEDDEVKPEKGLWWQRRAFNSFEIVPNPYQPIYADGTLHCFILIDLPEKELRKMKSEIIKQHEAEACGPLAFIEAGASLLSPDINGLMRWFEECMIDGKQPPHEFLAVDQQSFDYFVKNEGDGNEAMIIASSESMRNRHNDSGVHDLIGLAFGRLHADDGAINCVGLQVANQSFEDETIPKDNITYLYWSDIVEAERLDPDDDMMSLDGEYRREDLVFTAQPQNAVREASGS